MEEEKIKTPVVSVQEFILSYTAGENGAIEGERSQVVTAGGNGSPVSAVPADGHHFERWSDGSTANPRTDLSVTADLVVTALFAPNEYTLAYAVEGSGSIAGNARQKVKHGRDGGAVKAVPAVGSHFVQWSDGLTANPRTDLKVTGDREVTAHFSVNTYTLNYEAAENGTVEGAVSQQVTHGGEGREVTAVPAKGYHFVRWSDGVESADRVDREVAGDLAVRAEFAVNTYTVGGRVSGLVDGTEVVLQNNGGDDLSVTGDGEFVFETALLDGSAFSATVLTQPTSPNQTCKVSWGEGTVEDADVDEIAVDCVLNTYTVGGTVYGLPEGNELVLQNVGGDDLRVRGNGDFIFSAALDDGSPYEVAVSRQRLRPNWLCTVEHAAGVLAGSDVTDVEVSCFPELVLKAVPGKRRVDLNWNNEDFRGGTFNLCWAREDFDALGFQSCKDLKGGSLASQVSVPHPLNGLFNDIPYWFQLAVEQDGRRAYSKVVKAIPFGGLNDTGIDWCADGEANRSMEGTRTEKSAGCEATAAVRPGQDGWYGRDAQGRARALAKDGAGAAGFDFTKVCMSGEAAGQGSCPPNPTLGSGRNEWACTRDNVTGLTWEVKSSDGLRGEGHSYSWFNPNAALNGGEAGVQNGGRCADAGCDTAAFVQAVNAAGLCGTSDWRVPTRKELLSIVDNSRYAPSIDTKFFPNTQPGAFWSSTPYADQESSAWHVFFQYGEVYPSAKSQSHHLRLVRGRTVTFGLENP